MHWMIKCRSKPGTDELRTATIPAHTAHLDKYRDNTWFSGPIFTDDGTSAIGSLRFIEFPDRAAAVTYINTDPYSTEGIFESVDIQHWQPALEHKQLTYPRKDDTIQFIVQCADVADSAEMRAELRDAHRAYLDESGMVIARGPLKTDDGATITGSALLLDVADRAAAEELMANEPFNLAGVYGHVSIERWIFGHV
ncbi:MAG: YciI family protein [Alphaproteobacteria bacterium]|nr:YciI family protein [Alphaproteobacteria bacterium]